MSGAVRSVAGVGIGVGVATGLCALNLLLDDATDSLLGTEWIIPRPLYLIALWEAGAAGGYTAALVAGRAEDVHAVAMFVPVAMGTTVVAIASPSLGVSAYLVVLATLLGAPCGAGLRVWQKQRRRVGVGR